MDEFTQTMEFTSTQERLKAVFNSLDLKAKLCIAIMWKVWHLEQTHFSPQLREEIERDLVNCVHDWTRGDCGDPELNWLAGVFHACELVAGNNEHGG
jgi:hypothetical protein